MKLIKCKNIGVERVYDLSVDQEDHSFVLDNGVVAHNCAYVLSDRPIEEDIPVMEVGGVKRVTQPEHSQVEWAGLMKYDFLTVSAILDIQLALQYINKNKVLKTGYLEHKGEERFIWELPNDQDVYKMLSEGKAETIFQLNTSSVTPFVKRVKPKNIIDLATITSLVRPGPLDFIDEKTGRNMAEEYVERRYGRSKGDNDILNNLIPETYGVFVMQEQITKVTKELTKWDDEKAESVREAVGKKKLKLIRELEPQFVQDAVKNGISEKQAQEIWDMMATFGRYGFSLNHAAAYSVTAYACAFLKYHYPLEWWAAILTNATSKEVNEVFYRYTKDLLLPPDINLSTEKITIDYKQGKLRNRLSMINGVGGKAAGKIIENRPYDGIYDFVSKNVCGPSLSKKLIHVGVLDSLFKEENTLEEKILAYDKAVAKHKFNQKLEEYSGKIAQAINDKEVEKVEKFKQRYIDKGVKEVEADSEYMLLSPKKDFLMKKSVFPTINLDLNKILQRDSSTKILKGSKFPLVFNKYGREVYLFTGEQLQTLDDRTLTYDLDFCVAGYVVDMSEFSYKNNTRKALKLIIDSSGYISEKVIWPDYETGQLHYNEDLKKGCIAFFFYNKKAGKHYTNIREVTVEEKAL